MKKLFLVFLAVAALVLSLSGCVKTGGAPDPEKIVPARETLIENLKAKGHEIEELSSVEGSGLSVDRVIARDGDKFIDIVYGLSSEEAMEIFDLFRGMYPDGYYILARNGNYVYCVSDRSTFKNAGFKSKDNVGTQYING